ncbi:MAG: TraR/DksA C4-type zinc finger protein [Candidatus Aminicenantes bacterium]|nr:TraR/DksA C4-type zinc finger protein [Candidatus Aminicenantes bacterium]
MENKELEKFKKKLLKLKEELKKFIESNEDYSQTDYSTDELDQATELIEKMTGFAVSSNIHHNITEVEEALVRIENNTYGKCVNCNKDIPLKRLQVLPFTKYCVECQKEIEDTNRNYG